jgi:hypothetical protein
MMALAPAALLAALALGCGDGGPLNNSTATWTVVAGGTPQTVKLADVMLVTVDGEQWARLSDVALQAASVDSLASLKADFEASDGFKPGNRSNCKGLVPVQADKLEQGYVHPVSRNVRWEDVLNYPSCLSPRDLAKLILTN